MRGILADLPDVVAGATLPRSKPVAERCEIIGVDLFERVPAGADGYLMKYIVHGFNDKDALKIIKNCRQMMNLNAKLLLIERVLKPANEPDPGKFMDLQMLSSWRPAVGSGPKRTTKHSSMKGASFWSE